MQRLPIIKFCVNLNLCDGRASMAVLRLTAQCHINRDLHLQAGSFDPQHFPEWLHLLVSLSAAVCSPALMAAIPGASNIDHLETQH